MDFNMDFNGLQEASVLPSEMAKILNKQKKKVSFKKYPTMKQFSYKFKKHELLAKISAEAAKRYARLAKQKKQELALLEEQRLQAERNEIYAKNAAEKLKLALLAEEEELLEFERLEAEVQAEVLAAEELALFIADEKKIKDEVAAEKAEQELKASLNPEADLLTQAELMLGSRFGADLDDEEENRLAEKGIKEFRIFLPSDSFDSLEHTLVQDLPDCPFLLS